MGKNKKNKNLNQFIMDDEFVQTTNQTDTNTEPFETIPNKKKNPFQQLQNIESENDDEYCDGVHSIKSTKTIDKNTDTNTEPFETIPNKKKNINQQLQNTESVSDDEYCDCAQAKSTKTKNTDKKDDDFYFSRAYHSDDYENDYENAISLYKSSIELDSEYYKSVASYNLALIYDEKYKDFENAEKYYKLSCDKEYKNAFVNLGLLYFNQEKYSDAISYLKKSVDFGNTDIYYEYSFCLEKVGQKDEAFKYLKYHLILKNASIKEKKLWKSISKKVE